VNATVNGVVRVLLQARTTSRRLPAKAFLPLAGRPSALLAAQRAARDGADVRVATSNEPSDDTLAQLLQSHRIPVVRGSLGDVLGRFAAACGDLDDGATVVRITADNVVPDGDLIAQVAAAHDGDLARYVCTGTPETGLPYGVSVEAFSAGFLRAAARDAHADDDREHVTPWIKRRADCRAFTPRHALGDLSHLRATLDDIDDYLLLTRVLDGVTDPVAVSWRDLCARLRDRADPASRDGFVLGSAQLGMFYGIANATGLPSRIAAEEIIAAALAAGVRTFDTAAVYGCAERRLGTALAAHAARTTIVTKLPALALGDEPSAGYVSAAVDAAVLRSCRELGRGALDVLLLHHWASYAAFGGALWRRLVELEADGVITTLGVSVSTPQEAAAALDDPLVRHLQLPLNVLDRRWDEVGRRAAACGVRVHVRSVFLQGLIVSPPGRWPAIPNVDPQRISERLDSLVEQLNRSSRLDLAIAFVRAIPWVSGVVLGVETRAQLTTNLELFERSPLNDDERAAVEAVFADLPETLLNPARWATAAR
jgi:spore coat polysaccharide biosynthesis protein SpsF